MTLSVASAAAVSRFRAVVKASVLKLTSSCSSISRAACFTASESGREQGCGREEDRLGHTTLWEQPWYSLALHLLFGETGPAGNPCFPRSEVQELLLTQDKAKEPTTAAVGLQLPWLLPHLWLCRWKCQSSLIWMATYSISLLSTAASLATITSTGRVL